MTITFITGANKGLGHETARRLIECGHTVRVGARNREQGEEAAVALGARYVPIDVTDDASVTAAAANVAEREDRDRCPDQRYGAPSPSPTIPAGPSRTSSRRCTPRRRRR